MTAKNEVILSFRSECLKVLANEHCYSKFWNNSETNDRNVSVTKMSQQEVTEMSQQTKTQTMCHMFSCCMNTSVFCICIMPYLTFIVNAE